MPNEKSQTHEDEEHVLILVFASLACLLTLNLSVGDEFESFNARFI